MRLSQRVLSLKPSSTVAVMNKAKALKASGVDVLNFGAGEPDFNTPEPAKRAAIESITRNETKYIDTPGDVQTRELIAKLLSERNGVPNVSKDHVIITAGVKMALYLTFQALFDEPKSGREEDRAELLLPVPSWVSFAPMARLAGARVVEMPTTPEGQFKITPEQLEKAITPRTRALLMNSPSNPCSTMYTEAELRALAAVIDRAGKSVAPDMVVVSDELYQSIVFGSVPHFSIGAVKEIAERTVTINGPGKAFAMTGWRLGWASGSGEFGKQIVGAMTKLQGQSITCVPGFSLAAARAALTEAGAELETMRKAFAARAELIFSLLGGVAGVKVAKPIGAFYVFPDISAHLGKTSAGGRKINAAADFAGALLEEHQMAVVPGEDFSESTGHKHIRMSFACSEDQIRKGVDRLKAFIAGLK